MAILMDIIVIAIILLNIIIGYKKGLVNVIVNIFEFLLAIAVTVILYKPISNVIINNTQIDDRIRETIIVKNTEDNKENETNEENVNKFMANQIKEKTADAKEYAIETIADTIAINTVQILTGIILFVAIRFIITLLKFLTNNLSNIPVIKQFNKIGGVLYGLIRAIIIIYIILTILFFVVSINTNGIIASTIENTYITKFLYQNNIIINYCLLGKNLL